MGRPPQYLATKVSDYGCCLDIALLRRQGLRKVGVTGKSTWTERGETKAVVFITVVASDLSVRFGQSERSALTANPELLPLTITEAGFGGSRHWFSCPGCQRRCRKLYRDYRFLCRVCLGAKYDSQYDDALNSISAQRWKIRSVLEARNGLPWPCGLDDGFPPRPRGMHRSTYQRWLERDEMLEARWNAVMRAWLDRTREVRTKAGPETDPLILRLEQECGCAQHPTNG